MSNDIVQLQNLLEMYDDAVVDEVLHMRGGNGSASGNAARAVISAEPPAPTIISAGESGAWIQRSINEVTDPGAPLEQGEGGYVCKTEQPYIERIIQEANFLPAHFLVEGADVQRAVGRVTLKTPHAGLPAGNGWGTGFLVAPSILMTNNHVIPSTAFAAKVEVQFNYQLDHNGMPQTVDTYQFDTSRDFYTNAALDFTLIRLRKKYRFRHRFTPFNSETENNLTATLDRSAIDVATMHPLFWYYQAGDKWGHLTLNGNIAYSTDWQINIVQHPKGRRKEVAIHDNTVTNVYSNHLRYTTDTEPGSSGSPVFNNQWDLVAIHHAGGERQGNVWINNQGVRMDRIVANIRNNAPAALVSELGL